LVETSLALGALPFRGLLLPEDMLGGAMGASNWREPLLTSVAFPEGCLRFPNRIRGGAMRAVHGKI